MPVVTTAENVVTRPDVDERAAPRQPYSDDDGDVRMWPDTGPALEQAGWRPSKRRRICMLYKVFPIKLQPGRQAEAEAIVAEFAPKGPEQEPGTVSFRVYRDPANVDYLLFVEHFADQAAYDAHTGSAAYQELIAGRFAGLIVEFVEIDHELVASV